jgi:carbamoylphosphate synthase large subunit
MKRILLLGAGTGAANNLIRSLRAGDLDLVVVGAHVDRFTLRNSGADRNYLLPRSSHPRFTDALRTIVEREQIDLLMPNTDADVSVTSALRDVLPCRTFLPSKSVIERCQDKYELGRFLDTQGVPVAAVETVRDLTSLDEVFARFGKPARLWCRIRSGYASRGAAPVSSVEDARCWMAYWQRMRGIDPSDFTLSEYLPGRDFACQSLWKNGRLVLIKTVERLAHLDAETRASGTSSIASLARTVNEPRVVDICARAIRAVDPHASGAFSVDLKSNRAGVPCVTEINAGRFITMLNFFDFTGGHNMSATYVRLALDEAVDVDDPYDVVEDHYFVRGVDALPAIFSADQLFEGIEETTPGEDGPS